MQNIKKFKVLVVFTESSITDNRGITFVNSINNFTDMFEDVGCLSSSLCICINLASK